MIAQFSFAEKYGIFSCSYENLKTDGVGVVRELLSVLELPIDLKVIHSMLERSSFRFLTGRQPGKEDRKKFIRKGISGDWKNHFSEDDKTTFKRIAGDILIQLGYERDYEW